MLLPATDRHPVKRVAPHSPLPALLFSLFVFAAGCTGSTDDPPTAGALGTTSSSIVADTPVDEPTGTTTEIPGTTDEPACAPIGLDDDPQAVVSAAGPNRELCFEPGRYENFAVTPLTGQHFIAAEGTILDGMGAHQHAFSSTADTKADDVIIDGFEITGYASAERCSTFRSDCGDSPVRGGAIFPHLALDTDPVPDVIIEEQSSLRWVLRNSYVHDNLGTGVSVGEAMTVEDNVIESNSHLGIGGGTVTNITIDGNQIADNSYDDTIPAYWEAGQIKLGYIIDSTISGNTFSGGAGPAIWCDVQCSDVTIADNEISDIDAGLAVGIFYEISARGTISGNTLSNITGQCDLGPGDGAAILVSESQEVTVSDNTVNNSDSFVIVQQLDRNRFQGDLDHLRVTVSPDTDPLWQTVAVSVTDNSFSTTTSNCDKTPGGRVGLSVVDAGAHPNTENVQDEVTFANNDYLGTEATVGFLWPTADKSIDWEQWMALGLQ